MRVLETSRSSGPLLPLLLVGLSACGGGSSSSAPAYSGDPGFQTPSGNLTDGQRAALRTFVYCDHGKCNPSVGMLVSVARDGEVGACTASMIGKDLAVTNSHCLPADLKAPGAACGGRIYLFFPQVGTLAAERAECAEVLGASTLAERSNRPDYAFFRLRAPVSREPLRLSEDGFVHGERYRLAKVDPYPQNGVFTGALRSTECEAVYPTVLTPAAKSPDSPVVTFRNCRVEQGNSGSPILDDAGRIVGLLQSNFEPGITAGFTLALSGAMLDGIPREIALGTNLGCVAFPGALPERTLPSSCSALDTEASVEAEKKSSADRAIERLTPPALDAGLGSIAAPADSVFEWEAGTRTTGMIFRQETVVLVPKCFRPASEWIANYRNLFGRVKGSATVEVEIPHWRAKVGINGSLQIEARLDRGSMGFYSSKLKFSPLDLVEKGASLVTLVDRSAGLLANGKYLSERLSVCKPTR